MSPLLALVVPLGWAWLADRTQRHDRVLRVISFGAFVGFTPLAWAHGRAAQSFALILTGYVGYATFFVGMGGLADALAVARVRAGAVYGRLRLWGSVGYVLAAITVGALLGPYLLRLRGPLVPLRDVGGAGGRLRRLAQPRGNRRADGPPARRRHSRAAAASRGCA